MKREISLLCLVAVVLALGTGASAISVKGSVTDENGKSMNGVFVSALGAGSNYTTTVFSDDSGTFKFPDLPDGNYTVRAFARGFKDQVKTSIAIKKGNISELNFSLSEEKDAAARFKQATPGEWLASLPGPEEDKNLISKNCSGCHHNLTQIMQHRFTEENWLKIIRLMERLNSAHAILGVNEAPGDEGGRRPRHGVYDSLTLAGPTPRVWRYGKTEQIAAYLAKVQGPDSPVPNVKFHSRPTGRVTQAIITSYRIPRFNAAPHDVQIDKRGNIWYNDFKGPYIGRLDPRTGAFKEYKIKPPAPLHPGSDNMWVRPESVDDSIWVHERWAHRLIRLDPKTEKVSFLPEAGVEAIDPDGKTLISPEERLDLRSGTVSKIKYKGSTAGYGSAVDSKGLGYRGGIADGDIKKLNPETGEVISYKTPTPNSGPRRGCVDQDDNAWFGEWYAGKIAKLDSQAGQITEYSPSVPFAAFYEVCTDKKNRTVWGYDWHNDRLVKVNGRTGEMLEYPMPTLDNESRRTVVDTSTNPPSVWIYGMMEGLIIRVQAP